ncbi:hypothetical protein F4808DRAFT_221432 [Astrocystis sublimbata]|nr:hypothetical protein F4808DRAFT_221432 [Astrocystis sublimbata]
MLVLDTMPSFTVEPFESHDAPTQDADDEDVPMEEKGKEKATRLVFDIDQIMAESKASIDVSTVDWMNYEPPKGLRHTEDRDADMTVVERVIQESIARIKEGIAEEERQRLAADEERRKEEAASNEKEAARQSDSDEPEDVSQGIELYQPTTSEHHVPAQTGTKGDFFPTGLPKRPRKRTLMNLFRKRNTSGPEQGESSAAGAARHRRLLSSSTTVPTTHSARKRFVIELIKKATGEDTSSSRIPPEPEVECVSCLDDFDPKDTIRAPCHNYCKPCFRRLIASACQNEQHWPPKCCLNTIPSTTILAAVDAAGRTLYRSRAREWDIPLSERIYCSQPSCSLVIRPEYIITAQDLARCTEGHYTCTICRGARHDGDVCPQDTEMARTTALANEEGWRRCHGCGAYVEHESACRHMTCRCGAEFCYVCGARWQTCSCTMRHLVQLKDDAAKRRQQRLDREDKEAAEEAAVQEAIRLVEEFEREEALKTELLRQEQARLVEETRRAELEERIRVEGERRRGVMIKFEALRAVFDQLHVTQQALVTAHHEKRERNVVRTLEDSVRRFGEIQELERETERAKAEARISRREDKFRAEYIACMAEERKIVEQYTAKLQAFWGGRKDGEENMQAALLEVNHRMDEKCTAWKQWMGSELSAHCQRVQEEHALAEQLIDGKERRLQTRTMEVALTLARQTAAEMRWVREVMGERHRLLRDMESEEIESGEDIDAWFAEGTLDEAWLLSHGTNSAGVGVAM